jgi:F0F1-type ATP synthase delta subunit
MSNLSYNDIVKIIYIASKGKKDEDLNQFVEEVFQFLQKQKLINKSSIILKKLENIFNEEEKIIVAKLYSVSGLTTDVKNKIKDFIMDKYGAKKVFFLEKHDPKLIGGLKIEIRNEIIDLSVSNKLKKLRNHLIK